MVTEKRLIEANALLRRLQKRREDFASGWRTLDSMPDGAKAKYEENLACSLIIEDCPTVDAVEMVHGHKIVRERNRGIAYAMECPICNSRIPSNKPYTEKVEYCSVCGKKLDDTFKNYCPNCGAKMRGSEE